MKRAFLIVLALILTSALGASAEIEYEGYTGYSVDGFVIFVPESWGGGSSNGKTLFLPDEADRALVANVRHLSAYDDLTQEEYAGLVYGMSFRAMDLDNLQRERITLNGDYAEIWSSVSDTGNITAGLAYLHGSDFLSMYYQVFDGEQDPELTELRAICEKVTPYDMYY